MWNERLAAFVSRKEQQARTARIAGLTTVEDRAASFALQRLGSPWTRERFDGWFYWSAATRSPATSLVLVQSRDRNTVADDPSTIGGGDTDKHLIYEGLSRVHADAVLAGARTVTSSDVMFSIWHPELVRLRESLGKPRHPTQVVISVRRAVTLQHELIFNVPDAPAILITTDEEAAAYAPPAGRRPWVRVVTTGPAIDLVRAFETLFTVYGIRVVSAVGGRTTAAALIDAGLVQDLYLTTSATDAGEPNTPVYDRPLATDLVVRKRGRGEESGIVFEHFRLRPPEPRT
jgi:riboflavin biosynthesis pyrimidine reductase